MELCQPRPPKEKPEEQKEVPKPKRLPTQAEIDKQRAAVARLSERRKPNGDASTVTTVAISQKEESKKKVLKKLRQQMLNDKRRQEEKEKKRAAKQNGKLLAITNGPGEADEALPPAPSATGDDKPRHERRKSRQGSERGANRRTASQKSQKENRSGANDDRRSAAQRSSITRRSLNEPTASTKAK